jgi:hypothetical protein
VFSMVRVREGERIGLGIGLSNKLLSGSSQVGRIRYCTIPENSRIFPNNRLCDAPLIAASDQYSGYVNLH